MNHKTAPSRRESTHGRSETSRAARYTAMTAPCNKTEEPQLPAGRPNHHDHWHNARRNTPHTSTPPPLTAGAMGWRKKLDTSSFRHPSPDETQGRRGQKTLRCSPHNRRNGTRSNSATTAARRERAHELDSRRAQNPLGPPGPTRAPRTWENRRETGATNGNAPSLPSSRDVTLRHGAYEWSGRRLASAPGGASACGASLTRRHT